MNWMIYLIIGELHTLFLFLHPSAVNVHRYNTARYGRGTARTALVLTTTFIICAWPFLWPLVALNMWIANKKGHRP